MIEKDDWRLLHQNTGHHAPKGSHCGPQAPRRYCKDRAQVVACTPDGGRERGVP